MEVTSMEASITSAKASITSMEAFVEAFVEALVKFTSTEAFICPISSMEASTEAYGISHKRFRGRYFRGRFHAFHESFHGSFHEDFRGRFFRESFHNFREIFHYLP